MIAAGVISAAVLGGDLVEDGSTPDITSMNVIKSLVALAGEGVDGLGRADLVVLTPVVGHLKFGEFGCRIFAHTVVANDEGHHSAVFAEKSHRFEVGLDHGARFGYSKTLIG